MLGGAQSIRVLVLSPESVLPRAERENLLRPPLKSMLFPVQRPGQDITAQWELLFFANFFSSIISKFSYQNNKIEKRRGENRYCGRPLGTISATRWTGNTTFLRVA